MQPEQNGSGPSATLVRGGVIVGGFAALLATYWDDAFHTDTGRDGLAAPPHLLLYAGVALMLGFVAWRALSPQGRRRMRAGDPRLLLPVLGASVTIASAPIDEAWHTLFGRDAVIWSPPHMLAVMGLVAVAAGMLLDMDDLRSRSRSWVPAIMGAMVLTVTQITVLEFETDVPQFAVRWYLPVTITTSAFALAAIQLTRTTRWAATRAALLFTLARIAVLLFLLGLGGATAMVPPLLAGAAIDDVAVHRRWPVLIRAAAFTLVMTVAYAAVHAVVPDGLDIAAPEALVSLGLGTVGASVAHLAFTGRGRRGATPVLATVVLLLLLVPVPAFAHDPGQGTFVRGVQLEATPGGPGLVQFDVALAPPCADFELHRSVARRAGQEITGPLTRVDACRYSGSVVLPSDGRWFLYAEATALGEPVETWMNVTVPMTTPRARTTEFYAPPERNHARAQWVGGGVLMVLNLALMGAIVAAFRRRDRLSSDAAAP